MTHMDGKVALITGATNGIGEATALALARMGAETLVVGRSAEKCEATVEMIRQKTGNDRVRSYVADLSLMAHVRDLASRVRQDYSRLDVLVNNAGAWFRERKETTEGYEQTWALNHLAYFLLTAELQGLLKDTAAAYGEARVVSVSSLSHHEGYIRWEDIPYRNWDAGRGQFGAGWGVYSQSKFANVLFAYGLARRMEGTGVTSNAVHPAVVVTGFSQNNGPVYKILASVRRLWLKDGAHGAQPSVYVASDPAMRGVTGKFFGPPHKEERSAPDTYDVAMQDRLWKVTEEMLNEAVAVTV